MPTEPANTNAVEAMSDSRQRIPGDVVNAATADLPDDQRSAIRRLHAWYIEHGLSLEETAKLLRLDSAATISLIFRGKYPAKLNNVVEEIDRFFELQDKRSQGRKLQFIHTGLTKRIWKLCESAVEYQRIGFVFGESQIGKTAALQAYETAHNHGSTKYVYVPTGGSLTHFLSVLAAKCNISQNQRRADLRRRIIKCFDDRMLLIVDEAHRCVPEDGRSSQGLQTIEFIRELFDEAKCGVIICATNVFRNAMEDGPAKKLLVQTKLRRLAFCQLKSIPSRDDLNTFAAAYGLPPSTDKALALETQMVENEALGMWLTLLRMASSIASKHKQPMNWSHVLKANAGLQELEGK